MEGGMPVLVVNSVLAESRSLAFTLTYRTLLQITEFRRVKGPNLGDKIAVGSTEAFDGVVM